MKTENAARIEQIRRRLLDWYEAEARDLPWRRTDDPYAIWIAEVMLQQTRVETVVPYYRTFLDRFPTLEDLALASIDDVLKTWEGLGYYQRAHRLHRTARVVSDEHGGRLPSSIERLRRLPGIGPYTAAAIASIAYGVDEPVLDGNVVRVLARLFLISGDPARAATKAKLLDRATQLLPRSQASAFNQGLMDLGARICRSRSPHCAQCPLRRLCDAYHTNQQEVFPERPRRKQVPHIDVVAGAIWDGAPYASGGRLLIAQRKADDMLGGLWEFPGGRVEGGESHEQALVRELDEELAIAVEILAPFVTIEHAYTHFRITLTTYHVLHIGGEPTAVECAAWAWVQLDELERYALSAADRKLVAALRASSSAASTTSMERTSPRRPPSASGSRP